MNANTMELNLDELEMVTGGDLWNRVKGALVGAAVGCVGTTISGFIAAGPFGAAAGAISGAAGGAIKTEGRSFRLILLTLSLSFQRMLPAFRHRRGHSYIMHFLIPNTQKC